MPRRARIEFVSLKSSLVNLPISIYGPLVEHRVRPQALAVHLSLVPNVNDSRSATGKVQAYVGWTGMASASSLARFSNPGASSEGLETVEIDPQFAAGLGFKLGDTVEIGLLQDLPTASSVSTEPHSSDDWEILEIHADYVEQNLLSQVRVASEGQEVDVWVMGHTRVRLLITSVDPSQGKDKAALLAADTEVSIAPKTRTKNMKKLDEKQQSLTNGTSNAQTNGAQKTKSTKVALRVLPFPLLGLPSANKTGVAWVSPSTYCHLVTEKAPLSRPSTCRKVKIRRLKPPLDPMANEATPTAQPNNASPPAPRVLHATEGPTRASSGSSTETAKPEELEEVVLQWLGQVPDGHVAIEGAAPTLHVWDRVMLVSTQHTTSAIAIPATDDPIPPAIGRPSGAHFNLAGVDEMLSNLTSKLSHNLAIQSASEHTQGVYAALVTGRPGSGKTAIARAAAQYLEEDSRIHAHTIYVDMSKHSETRATQLKAYFQYLRDKALWHKPAVVVLDNIDKVMCAEVEHADSFRYRHLAELFLTTFCSRSSNVKGIVLVATAESDASIHALLSSAHIFKDIINLKSPNKDARRDILMQVIQSRFKAVKGLSEDPATPLNYMALATQTDGYSVNDLKDLVGRAVQQAAIRASRNAEDDGSSVVLSSSDFDKAIETFAPLSLRDVNLQKSNVAWSDIGGLHYTRRVLRETLEWPTKYAAIFAKCPLRLRSGLLLYGYPGCGKTLLASAVAKECGLNFISVKGPELLNKYIGASEKSVRDLFERAVAAKPCVLFFDEFDSIAPKRGHDSTGVTDRVVNQMLTQMDGAEGLDGVYVLAATSRPDLIDPALLRPGRLDKSLICDMPNEAERQEILEVLTKKIHVHASVDLTHWARRTDGYSGADLQALMYNAHLAVVHASIADAPDVGADAKGKGKAKAKDEGKTGSGEPDEIKVDYVSIGLKNEGTRSRADEAAFQRRLQRIVAGGMDQKATSTPVNASSKFVVTEDQLEESLATTRPSVPAQERQRLQRIYAAFVDDRSGELPVPPEEGSVGTRVSLG